MQTQLCLQRRVTEEITLVCHDSLLTTLSWVLQDFLLCSRHPQKPCPIKWVFHHRVEQIITQKIFEIAFFFSVCVCMNVTATLRGNKNDIIRLNLISPAPESMELISYWFRLWIPHCLHPAEDKMNRLKNDCFDNLEKIVYMKLMDLFEIFWTKVSFWKGCLGFYFCLGHKGQHTLKQEHKCWWFLVLGEPHKKLASIWKLLSTEVFNDFKQVFKFPLVLDAKSNYFIACIANLACSALTSLWREKLLKKIILIE